MSIQRQVRRLLPVLGLVLFAASPAAAQSEPEFVPYVNDLQMFDQPDLSSYGRGVAPPQGWFGSAEYLNWSVQAPPKQTIGSTTPRLVYAPGATTQLTYAQTPTTITVFNTTNIALTLTNVTVTINGVGVSTTISTTVPVTYTINTPGLTIQSSTTGLQQGIPQSGFVTQTSSLDTGYMNSDFTSGGRFEFGRVNDGRGWMVSTFNLGTQTSIMDVTNVSMNFDNGPTGFIDISGGVTGTSGLTDPAFLGDGFDDDLDGDGVYGRHGRDRGTRNGNVITPPLDGIPDPENPGSQTIPIDFDDAVNLPVVFQSLNVENRTSTYGVEVNRLWQLALGPRGGVWEFFVGPRYLNIRDDFMFDGRGPDTNPQYYINSVTDTYCDTTVENNVFGGQFGARWSIQRQRWQLSIETRFLAAANFQNAKQMGQFASRYMTVVPEGTTNTNPLRDDIMNAQLPHQFNSSVNTVEFAPTGEIRANLKYQVFRSVYVTAGYTAIYADGIARASRMVNYSFPTMGLNENRNQDGLFMNGINFGLVINR